MKNGELSIIFSVQRTGGRPTGPDPENMVGDITRFRLWTPFATGNHLHHAEKIPKFSQRTGTVDFFNPRSGILGPTSRRASAYLNPHEWWTKAAHVICSCLSIDLAEILRSSKISPWIWSIISRVVTIFCRPGRGASQVEKSPRLN